MKINKYIYVPIVCACTLLYCKGVMDNNWTVRYVAVRKHIGKL